MVRWFDTRPWHPCSQNKRWLKAGVMMFSEYKWECISELFSFWAGRNVLIMFIPACGCPLLFRRIWSFLNAYLCVRICRRHCNLKQFEPFSAVSLPWYQRKLKTVVAVQPSRSWLRDRLSLRVAGSIAVCNKDVSWACYDDNLPNMICRDYLLHFFWAALFWGHVPWYRQGSYLLLPFFS